MGHAPAFHLCQRGAFAQPSGLLQEERSVLRIEALSRLGRQAEAERLAAQLLTRYPTSFHGKRVRELIGGLNGQPRAQSAEGERSP